MPGGKYNPTQVKEGRNIRPHEDRVLIVPDENQEFTKSGLYLPPQVSETYGRAQTGTIVAVGPGRFEKGKRIPVTVKVGDKVSYGPWLGLEIRRGSEFFLLMPERDLFGVFDV